VLFPLNLLESVMSRFALVLLALTTASTAPTSAERSAPNLKLFGRWDLVVQTPQGSFPSWLEMGHSGRDATVGRFVGIVGSARPIARVDVTGDSLHFAIPHQWEDGEGDLVVDGRLDGDRLVGRMTFPDGRTAEWTGTRAPAMTRTSPVTWGTPVALLSANSLNGWHTVGGTENQWVVENGLLRSPRSGANIATDRTFGDFKLHIEFRYPAGSNSGVYLRGRHEVQIQDDHGKETASDNFAGVYGFIEPNEMAALPAGQWQTYDITLLGRRVTIVANGKTVICEREIPGITGGALDSNEGAPGPILLQGDHGPVEFRNIIITPAR
jgi:hypothetical protein